MTNEQRVLLEESDDSIAAAQLLLSGGYSGYAAARAYYAMFYVAQAYLEGIGQSFSSHAGVIAAFGKEFCATDRVPREFHRYLIAGQQLRHSADYGQRHAVTTEECSVQIERAKELVAHARQNL